MPYHSILKHPLFWDSVSCLNFCNYSDLILQDDFKAKLNEENSLILDRIDTSLVFKRETSNTLDIIQGIPDEDDFDHLLSKTVQAQIKVSTNNSSTNNSPSSITNKKIQLTTNNTEFGDFCHFFSYQISKLIIS